jgi:hypothetical protein
LGLRLLTPAQPIIFPHPRTAINPPTFHDRTPPLNSVFHHNSRYHPIATALYSAADGRTIAYKRRRFLPQGRAMESWQQVTVSENDRLDHIAFRTLDDPEQFWQICDANDAMNPDDLVAEVGRVLVIPLPQA